jgi:CBS domain containing-hemolysin-like protein
MHALKLYETETIDTLAWPSDSHQIDLTSSALCVFTDFRQQLPIVIDGNMKAIELERLMKQSHVKMKLILDNRKQFCGIVTLADLTEQRMMQKVVQFGLPREELLAIDFMQPKSQLLSFDYEQLKVSSVGDVVETLKESGHMHSLVIDRIAHEIRGVISVSDIARMLRLPLDIQSQPSFIALSSVIAA